MPELPRVSTNSRRRTNRWNIHGKHQNRRSARSIHSASGKRNYWQCAWPGNLRFAICESCASVATGQHRIRPVPIPRLAPVAGCGEARSRNPLRRRIITELRKGCVNWCGACSVSTRKSHFGALYVTTQHKCPVRVLGQPHRYASITIRRGEKE